MSVSYLLLKYAVTATLVVVASEIAKRSDKIGALILSLPLMSIITLIWLYAEGQGEAKIANHAWYTFWYVLPTLPMFLIFPVLLKHVGFLAAMVIFPAGMTILLLTAALILRKFGIELL